MMPLFPKSWLTLISEALVHEGWVSAELGTLLGTGDVE